QGESVGHVEFRERRGRAGDVHVAVGRAAHEIIVPRGVEEIRIVLARVLGDAGVLQETDADIEVRLGHAVGRVGGRHVTIRSARYHELTAGVGGVVIGEVGRLARTVAVYARGALGQVEQARTADVA